MACNAIHHPRTSAASYQSGYWRLQGSGVQENFDGWDTGTLNVKFQGTIYSFLSFFSRGNAHPDHGGLYVLNASYNRVRGNYVYGTVQYEGLINPNRPASEEISYYPRDMEKRSEDYTPNRVWYVPGGIASSVRVSNIKVSARKKFVSSSLPSSARLTNLYPDGMTLPIPPSEELLQWLATEMTYVFPSGWTLRNGSARKHSTKPLWLIELDFTHENDWQPN